MEPTLAHPPFQGIKKILLITLKHSGDVVLITPCIRALHRAFPAAEILALVNEENRELLKNHPLLGGVIGFPRAAMRGRSVGRIRREINFAMGLRQRRIDLVVDFTSADRAAWLGWFSGARYRLAYDPQGKGFFGKRRFYTHLVSYPTDPDLHQVRKNLGVLEHFGIHSDHPRLELHIDPSDDEIASATLRRLGLLDEDCARATTASKPFVMVHPTSRWLFKCWEDQRFAEVIDWLQTVRQQPVIVTCGPDRRELDRAQRVLALCTTQPRALLGELTFPQWAGLVRRARLFLGVDSAPVHIAASQGTPTVALFGPTGFQNWRPWNVPHAVLVHDCPCSRDRNPHCDWSRTRACLLAITVEEVIRATDRLLNSAA